MGRAFTWSLYLFVCIATTLFAHCFAYDDLPFRTIADSPKESLVLFYKSSDSSSKEDLELLENIEKVIVRGYIFT